MESSSNNQRIAYLAFAFYTIALLFSAFYFPTIGDSGDSVMHFLFAKYAPQHPELYFDHWAKPVFVMLCSPFAQLGFIGAKLFNVIAQLLALFFIYKVAVALNLKRSLVVTVMVFFAPLNYVLTFSGLTEPLFSCWLAAFFYLYLAREKHTTAAILLSFLPFVRTEGFLVIALVAAFFLLDRRFKEIALLGLGTVIFSLVGSIYHDDIFWVISKNPYVTEATYGSGKLLHFVDQLAYVVGIPIYGLMIAGLIAMCIKKELRSNRSLWMITLIFLIYLITHSIFWYLGLFHSMGLKRVMLGVMPCMAILALLGFNLLADLTPETSKASKPIFFVLLALVLFFPFLGNPASVHWKSEMQESELQKNCKKIAEVCKKYDQANTRYCYISPYLSVTMDVDYFDPKKHVWLSEYQLSNLKKGDVVIWDSWFCVVEAGIDRDEVLSKYRLNVVQEFPSAGGSDPSYLILEKN